MVARPEMYPTVAPMTTSVGKCFACSMRDSATRLASAESGMPARLPWSCDETVANANAAAACPEGNDHLLSPFGRGRRTTSFVAVTTEPATMSPWLTVTRALLGRVKRWMYGLVWKY